MRASENRFSFAHASFALLIAAGLLSACSGGPQGAIPGPKTQGGMLAPMAVLPPTPGPVSPWTILAAVDINVTTLGTATFTLTSPTACFGGTTSGTGDDEDHQGDEDHHGDGDHHGRHEGRHGHHHHGGSAPTYGSPYTPTSNTVVVFGAFTLTDPCAGSGTGSGDGDSHHSESQSRHALNIIPSPPPGGAVILALDSTDATHTPMVVDGPATSSSPGSYTFSQQRFGRIFRVGHTYTFALAIPATATPTPAPTPTHGDDD